MCNQEHADTFELMRYQDRHCIYDLSPLFHCIFGNCHMNAASIHSTVNFESIINHRLKQARRKLEIEISKWKNTSGCVRHADGSITIIPICNPLANGKGVLYLVASTYMQPMGMEGLEEV
jgi:hypothetical protein